jgi:hypothetical protein
VPRPRVLVPGRCLMPVPVPARCVGRSVLGEPVAPHPCSRPAPLVFAWARRGGHDGVARACEPHGLRIVVEQDANPGTQCPECDGPAWFCVYCGFCRKGAHGECRAYRGAARAMAGHSPLRAEEHCACTCNPYDPMVPGIRGAREHREAT